MTSKNINYLTVVALALVMLALMTHVVVAETVYCNNCSDCSEKIQNANQSDVVMLTANITDFDDTCICFNDSDGIVFDGGGYTIDGVSRSNSGVYLSRYSNANTIRNFTVTDFDAGILLFSADNNEIYDVEAYLNDDGISVMDSDGNNVHDCILQENRWFDLFFCIRAKIDCDNICTNVTGSGGRPIGYYVGEHHLSDMEFSALYLANADNSTCDNITVCGSSTYTNNGLRLSYTNNTTMANIRSFENYNGVYLDESYGNYISDVFCNFTYVGGSEAAAIYASDSDYNYFKNVTASFCGQTGIRLHHSSYNVIDGANVTDTTYGGIRIAYGRNNTLNNSHITRSGSLSNGLSIVNSESNLVYNNCFDNSVNAYVNNWNVDNDSTWNVTNRTGPNIFGGPFIGGNYWSDYGGWDTRPDGFGVEPYTIEANNTDRLPLVIAGSPDMWIRNDGYDIEVGDVWEYLVTCRNGSNIDVNCTNLTWYSSNETVGTLEPTVYGANFTALVAGHTNITVSGYGGLSDTVLQNVTDSMTCGDNDCDGFIAINDAVETYYRTVDPDCLLGNEWAADTDGDGLITINDVVETYFAVVDPSYSLNCRE